MPKKTHKILKTNARSFNTGHPAFVWECPIRSNQLNQQRSCPYKHLWLHYKYSDWDYQLAILNQHGQHHLSLQPMHIKLDIQHSSVSSISRLIVVSIIHCYNPSSIVIIHHRSITISISSSSSLDTSTHRPGKHNFIE